MNVACAPDVACTQSAEVYAREVREGLPVDSVYDVAVDGDGWVWIASPGGLFRYDGRSARRWGLAAPRGADGPFGVGRVVAVRGDRALVIEDWGRLAWLGPDEREPVVGPDGHVLHGVDAAALSADGTLWIAWDDALYHRSDAGWTRSPVDAWRLWPAADGGAWVGTEQSLVRVDRDGAVTGSAALGWPAALATGAWVVGFDGHVAIWDRGALTAVATLPIQRVTGAVLRGDTLWVSLATGVIGVRDRHLLVLGPEGALSGGMGIALDREGSLWIGHHNGLYHVPSPETRIWTDREGLPERGGRAIADVGGRVWVTSWHEPVVIEPDGSVSETPFTGASTEPCVDRRGHTWLGGQHARGARRLSVPPGRRGVRPAARLGPRPGRSGGRRDRRAVDRHRRRPVAPPGRRRAGPGRAGGRARGPGAGGRGRHGVVLGGVRDLLGQLGIAALRRGGDRVPAGRSGDLDRRPGGGRRRRLGQHRRRRGPAPARGGRVGRGFQNPDGGWAAFSHGKPTPPRGALYLRRGGPWARLRSWLAENGDPSTADIVGRVL